MQEEYEILENTVRDFNSKFVDNISLKLENEGMPKEFIKNLSDQGFFSMTYQQGSGKNTDLTAYSLILETLAKSAPAIAVKALLTNSFLKLVNEEDVLDQVSKGLKSGTVTFSDILVRKGQNGKLILEEGKIRGEKEFVVGSDSDYVVTILDSGELVLLKSGFTESKKHKKLGFRSIGFASLIVDSNDYTVIDPKGRDALGKLYDDISVPVAAIAIGMSEGVSLKALEYAKVRTAFGHYLKDFQPLAFEMSSLVAEMEILKRYLYSILSEKGSSKEALFLKIRSLKLAKEMSKMSLQVHGGYGYLEDFGIEKFYRDSMALSVLFHEEEKDMERLSEMVFESKAGFV